MRTISTVVKVGDTRQSKYGSGTITTIHCEDLITREPRFAYVKHRINSRRSGLMNIFQVGNAVVGNLREDSRGNMTVIDTDRSNPQIATPMDIEEYITGK